MYTMHFSRNGHGRPMSGWSLAQSGGEKSCTNAGQINRQNVLAREGIRGVRDQETRLSDGTISNNHTLDGLHRARQKS